MLDEVESIWPAVIRDLRLHDRVVYVILHSVRPIAVAGSTITLLVTSPFHKKRIEQPDNRHVIEERLSYHLGAAFCICCTTSGHLATPGREEQPASLCCNEYRVQNAQEAPAECKSDTPPSAPLSPDSDTGPIVEEDEQPVASQDIMLIPHLHRTTAKELQRRGLTTLTQVARLSLRDWQCLPQVNKKQAVILRASVQALTTGKPVPMRPHQPMLPGFESFRTTASLFLDLESRPGSQYPFAFGMMTPAGAAHIAIIAPLALSRCAEPVVIDDTALSFIASTAEGWQSIVQTIGQTSGKVMHWGLYEQTCLKRSAPRSVTEQLLPSLFDVHRELTHQVALPIGRVNGQGCTTLKAVGNYLGITWPPGTGWQEAWNVYQAWYHGNTSHYELLTPLVRYLWTDLEALRQVWQWLVQIV